MRIPHQPPSGRIHVDLLLLRLGLRSVYETHGALAVGRIDVPAATRNALHFSGDGHVQCGRLRL